MKVLVISPYGEGEIKNIIDLSSVVKGKPLLERPFVDKSIVFTTCADAPEWAEFNQAITLKRTYGTVVFAKTDGKYGTYVDIDEGTVEKLILRFPRIKMKEKSGCQKILLFLLERLKRCHIRSVKRDG